MDRYNFTAQDFLRDEYFLTWVLEPDDENTSFWENWLSENPRHKPEADKARQLLLDPAFGPAHLPGHKVESIWENIAENMAETRHMRVVPQKAPVQTRSFATWYRVAAVFIFVLLAGGGFWKYQQYQHPLIVISTNFGETKTILLPDSSIAVLNGNSTISYTGGWGSSTGREVTLEGEAFFSVIHTKGHRKFRVKISDKVNVEVLGTEFTVTRRPQKTRVVLNEGKVKVAVSREKMFGLASAKIAEAMMKPGDLLELVGEAGQLSKRQVENPEAYAAFLQNKIIFKDAPLSEVARLLEDTYGYKITFARASIASRRFTGSSANHRIDMLLMAIGKSFNLKIIQNGKNITIAQV